MNRNKISMHLYNTKTRQVEPFEPLNAPKVLMYTCGPTVYNHAHIGNLRTYVFEDLLRKTLEFLGHDVYQVMNITDVDDKTIKNALLNKQTLNDYVAPFIKGFFEDLNSLSIQKAAKYPKATDYISEMVEMIQKLLDTGIAYKGEDQSVYFSISKFPHYGQLSRLKLEDLQSGASGRINNDEYEKESASDFVLWKAYDDSRDGNIYWDSPFGKGRPGWHIECSAMATALLGKTIDIHCGGVDNIFPHHENEIAQSECCSKQVFSRFWMHSEHLLVNNQKMSKSLGNFYTLKDILEKGYLAREVRFLLLQGHYRTQLNFTFEGLLSAKASLQRIDDFMHRMESVDFNAPENKKMDLYITNARKEFISSLADDLNISEALACIYNLIRQINAIADKQELSSKNALAVMDFLQDMDKVLSLLNSKSETDEISDEMQNLLDRRNQARDQQDWAKADELRNEIENRGFIIEDSPQGSRLKLKLK